MQLFISRIGEDPFFVLSWMLVVVFSICVHELAHAWTALRCGDGTAADHGHLTLNPLVQMGWGSLMVLVLFGIAWGAVPVDVSRLRSYRQAAWVAAAGPLANGVLFLFNLLPVPMFDGWAILSVLVPGMQRVNQGSIQSISWLFLALIWMTPLGGYIWQAGSRVAFALILGWAWVADLVM